jgi:uncharacterized lipoprotein YajG
MNAILLVILLLLAACVPQPTTKPSVPPVPPSKPGVIRFIDILERVQS